MKLNNKGWGLRQMLIMSSIIFIFLLIAAYYIYALYNNLDVQTGKQYATLEFELQTAAVNYHMQYPNDNIITLSELKNKGIISIFTDSNDKDCNGYVIVNQTDYKSYISCEFYTTKNYDKKYE